MATQRLQFTAFSRLLHWTMAAMILTMLCIGVAMVASLNNYHVLVSIHRPLGITILILVVVRFVNRLLNPPPDFELAAHRHEFRIALDVGDKVEHVGGGMPDPALVGELRH